MHHVFLDFFSLTGSPFLLFMIYRRWFQIDVLLLYTPRAMYASDSTGGAIKSTAQMETDLVTAYAMANDALKDSGVDFTLNVVHMQQVRKHNSKPAG